jgi:hypothetical protein
MVHCGFEATAVQDAVVRPWKAAWVALRGVRTEGDFAPDIPLDKQRPAQYVFDANVATLSQLREAEIKQRAEKTPTAA